MKLYFDIAIMDEYGKVHGRLKREVSEKAAFVGSRPVNEAKMFMSVGMGAATDIIEMMRVREFRKSLLMNEARIGGQALAEHLEDREGWHGIERQERVEKLYT